MFKSRPVSEVVSIFEISISIHYGVDLYAFVVAEPDDNNKNNNDNLMLFFFFFNFFNFFFCIFFLESGHFLN